MYDAQCEQVGVEGTKLIKVWSYSKRPRIAEMQAQKNAVHAAIFKGFAGNSETGCPAQAPLISNPEIENQKAAFFDAFFADGGSFMKYVSASADAEVHAEDVVRIKDKYKRDIYKIGVVVTVMYDQLRKDLEKEGIINGLSSGF